jgi:hypothetical protein
MIIRVTKKLAKKLKINELGDVDYEVHPLAEWYGHLFKAGRLQYIIFTNAYSLYTAVIQGKGITNTRSLLDVSFAYLDQLLRNEGCGEIMGKYITPSSGIIDICKTVNRGVLGSMNDMIFHSRYFLLEEGLTPYELSERINTMIWGYLRTKNSMFGNSLDFLRKYCS